LFSFVFCFRRVPLFDLPPVNGLSSRRWQSRIQFSCAELSLKFWDTCRRPEKKVDHCGFIRNGLDDILTAQ
jgi:hypothetical protein